MPSIDLISKNSIFLSLKNSFNISHLSIVLIWSSLPLIKIGSVDDHILKATVSVKGKRVYINIDGFLNELDAMLWAKQQNVLWNRELERYLDSPPSSPMLH